MIPGVADRFINRDGAELRIRIQQAASRDGLAVNRIGAVERVREARSQIVDGVLIADQRLAQVLLRKRVHVSGDLDARAAVADVGDLGLELAGKQVLNPKRPSLVEGVLAVAPVKGERLPQVGAQSACGAQGLDQPVGEGLRQGGDIGHAAVHRNLHRGGGTETGLNRVVAVDADRVEEDAVAGAQNRSRPELVGQADARHEVVLLRVPDPARIGRDTRECRTSHHLESAGRQFRNLGARGVIGLRLSRDRTRLIIGEARHRPVVTFRDRRLVLPPHTQIQGELAGEVDVVLHVQAGVDLLVDIASGFRNITRRRRQPEQERRDFAAHGRRRRRVVRTVRVSAAEREIRHHVKRVDVRGFARQASSESELDAVLAMEFGETGVQRVDQPAPIADCGVALQRCERGYRDAREVQAAGFRQLRQKAG